MNAPPKNRSPREGGLGKYDSTESTKNTALPCGPQPPGFVVIERKEGGREVIVGGPYDEATARSVVNLLRWAGAVARVEPEP